MMFLWLPLALAAERVAVIVYGDQPEAVAYIRGELRSYFITPLPSLVKVYEFIADKDIADVRPKDKEVNRDAIRAFAEKAPADIVVAVQLTDYRTRGILSISGNYIRTTSVAVKYHIYLAKQDRYMADRLSRYYQDEDFRYGSPEYLLGEIMDDITEKLRKELPYNPAVILRQVETVQ
jgi:hypothetical protein